MRRLTLLLCVFPLYLFAQNNPTEFDLKSFGLDDHFRGLHKVRIMFYNVENLFDCENDTLKNDEEFLPEGERRWNSYRYWKKQKVLAQTIIAAGGWDGVDMIGLCEIENKKVLEDLIYCTSLSSSPYEIAHFESPDLRGVDVALLYRSDRIKVFHAEPLQPNLSEFSTRPTRDILYVKTLIGGSDTLHVFVNHWPSNYGGGPDKQAKRSKCAQLIRRKMDSITIIDPTANFLAMGDFNCEAWSPPLKEDLQVIQLNASTITQKNKILISFPSKPKQHLKNPHSPGTHKFQGKWSIIDQFLISPNLISIKNSSESTLIKLNQGKKSRQSWSIIFDPPWLLQEETVNLGFKPFRTYQGPMYKGGVSDHLPIILDLKIEN